jgi:hypothetical protein
LRRGLISCERGEGEPSLGATDILPVGNAERVPTSALAGCQWHSNDRKRGYKLSQIAAVSRPA